MKDRAGTKTAGPPSHRALAEALRERVIDGPGETDAALRRQVAECAATGAAAPAPYDVLARRIGAEPQRTTDSDVERIVAETGSEKAAFEIVLAASVGAGLFRWECAMKALEGVRDATARG